MKKAEIIVAVVGLVIVAAVLVGIVAFVANYDKMIEDLTDTTDSTNKDISGSNTAVTPTNRDFKTDGDLGFITQNGVTTFFVIVSAPEHLSSVSCYRNWCFDYTKGTLSVGSENKDLIHKYSVDDGFTWKDLTAKDALNHSLDIYTVGGSVSALPSQNDKVYLALYQIEDCANPVSELESIRENCLREDDRITGNCTWCGGVYNTYSTFELSIGHRQIPDDDGALG